MTKSIRIVSALLGILVVASGAAGELYYGGLCTLGIGRLWVTCPLGFLERSLAAQVILPEWRSALLVLISIVVLGRAICGWLCPAGLLQRLAPGKIAPRARRVAASKAEAWAPYYPYAILAGTLVASFILRFPVFCFVCPIGLFFGFVYAAIGLFSPEPFTVELIAFPVLLGLELFVLRSWCRSICPLGALYSIFGNLNRVLVPAFRKDKCLTSNGSKCGACERSCPEGIEIGQIRSRFWPQSCTKCLECYETCPKGAIEFPILK